MELSKKDIPKEDRCEDFDRLWRQTYYEVLKYWNKVEEEEISDISEVVDLLID